MRRQDGGREKEGRNTFAGQRNDDEHPLSTLGEVIRGLAHRDEGLRPRQRRTQRGRGSVLFEPIPRMREKRGTDLARVRVSLKHPQLPLPLPLLPRSGSEPLRWRRPEAADCRLLTASSRVAAHGQRESVELMS